MIQRPGGAGEMNPALSHRGAAPTGSLADDDHQLEAGAGTDEPLVPVVHHEEPPWLSRWVSVNPPAGFPNPLMFTSRHLHFVAKTTVQEVSPQVR